MAVIDPSPSREELESLAAVFKQAEASLEKYLSTEEGQKDANFTKLTSAAISLNNAADGIAIMQLHLAVEQGAEALEVINQTTADLQHAIIVRNEITRDLGIVQSVVAFGAAIAAGDIKSVISSGSDLYNKLTSG